MIADLRKAIKEEAPVERVRPLREALQAAAGRLAPSGEQPAPRGGGGRGGDDVIDADYTER